MAWINLLIAGMLEVFWAISLKYADGFSGSGRVLQSVPA